MSKKYIDTKLYSNFENVNKDFVKCTISVMDCVNIANGTKFTKDSVTKAMSGLNYLPVIGVYSYENIDNVDKEGGDFQGHGISYIIDENGEFKRTCRTIPYGVVIKDSARFENVMQQNGEYLEMLVCDCYLWKSRNEAAINKVMENNENQSMEIEVNNYEFKNNYMEVTDFDFKSLCIISVDPAFTNAKIRTCDSFEENQNKFSLEYKEMIQALNVYLEPERSDNMEDNKEFEENEPKDEVDEAKKKRKCSDEDVEEKELDNENKDNEKEVEESKKKKKCSKEDPIDYEAKFNEVSVELENLRKEFMLLENERNELLEFKQEIEAKELSEKQCALLEKFSMLEGFEGFDALKENINNYSLEDLENQLFALLGKKNFSANVKKQTKKSNESVKVQVFEKAEQQLSEAERRYGADIKKYIK